MSKLLKFAKKNNLFLHANAIWHYDKNLNVSTIVWPVDRKTNKIEYDPFSGGRRNVLTDYNRLCDTKIRKLYS
jgi:hypothetical protein